MVVSVVDAGGHLVAFARMNGVPYMAVEVTRRKAVTACSFGLPTQVLTNIADSEPAVGADLAKNPEVCMVAGGLPIMMAGICVGGLGVAGGRSAQIKPLQKRPCQAIRQWVDGCGVHRLRPNPQLIGGQVSSHPHLG